MRRRAEWPTSYSAKGKIVIRYSRNISIVSCPAAILSFLFTHLFIGNIIPEINIKNKCRPYFYLLYQYY
ncbi:hypothetical protein AHT46_17200 [Salmonella enterica]|uniref:Uncharacterized protein n=2 Tax=Salmonella enterica TaxID=28901 RepID=A0A3V8I4E1_SALER|nr:hypothetical protein ELZ76_06760 [Salmonella enterica subsp. salamae serovar 42:r:-]EAA7841710.1 hypothetical protein [Salmonella enterica]ECC9157218.1 hypothetical protein [Salmonella enterica subsp. salamae]AZT54308.1 hypothetical protein EL009_06775 [Salmonella enterica subsp. salamae serovar 42:r:-]EAA9058629.1 hypothetical protein [Salmonella enterica]